MTINDWLTLQTRKDLVTLKRSLEKQTTWRWSIVLEVFFLILAFSLDNIFSQEDAVNAIWLGIAIAGALIPPIVLLVDFCIEKRRQYREARVHTIADFVSLFDDEVCYMVMSADNFCQSFTETSSIKEKKVCLLAEFYYIESNYYLNKAVGALHSMSVSLSSIIDATESRQDRISKSRFLNLADLILEIYSELSKHKSCLWPVDVPTSIASAPCQREILENLRKRVSIM